MFILFLIKILQKNILCNLFNFLHHYLIWHSILILKQIRDNYLMCSTSLHLNNGSFEKWYDIWDILTPMGKCVDISIICSIHLLGLAVRNLVRSAICSICVQWDLSLVRAKANGVSINQLSVLWISFVWSVYNGVVELHNLAENKPSLLGKCGKHKEVQMQSLLKRAGNIVHLTRFVTV